MTCLNILFTRYTNFYNEKNGYCFSPVVSTAHEIKKMPGLLMARGTKILVILITLALNEQGFSSIHREKTERQDRPKHLEDMSIPDDFVVIVLLSVVWWSGYQSK